jgi:PTH1 family peptidyl-tRNA hydrolase
MKAIIGLGNPGPRYARNRHNVGFMVLDRLATSWKAQDWFTRYQARIANSSLFGAKIILAKPQTFMNNSGNAVKAILGAYGVPPEDLLLIYDDLDLEIGQLRLRRKGSAGGHKGAASVMAELGAHEFHRLRLGIGGPPLGETVVDYVLGDFSQDQWQVMQSVIDIAVKAATCWVSAGIDAAMAEFNGTFLGE